MGSSGDSLPLVMEAIERAIATTDISGRTWQVCVRNPEGPDLISFKLGTYKEVESLAAEIRQLGYQLTLLHPIHTQCDFVLEPKRQEDDDDDGGQPGPCRAS